MKRLKLGRIAGLVGMGVVVGIWIERTESTEAAGALVIGLALLVSVFEVLWALPATVREFRWPRRRVGGWAAIRQAERLAHDRNRWNRWNELSDAEKIRAGLDVATALTQAERDAQHRNRWKGQP